MDVRSKLITCIQKAIIDGQSSLMNNQEDITFEIRPCIPDRVVVIRKEDGQKIYSVRYESFNYNVKLLLDFMDSSHSAV
jgi:hypothetical protein